MLSLWAKIKSSAGDANAEGTSQLMDIDEETTIGQGLNKADLLILSRQVDLQYEKMNALLNGGAPTSEDCVFVDDVVKAFNSELNDIEAILGNLESSITQKRQSTENLIQSIRQWLDGNSEPSDPLTETIKSTPQTQERHFSKFLTPLRQPRTSMGTPKTSRRGSGIDFDAFPQTPTLDQIGISQNTLEAVGFARTCSGIINRLYLDSLLLIDCLF